MVETRAKKGRYPNRKVGKNAEQKTKIIKVQENDKGSTVDTNNNSNIIDDTGENARNLIENDLGLEDHTGAENVESESHIVDNAIKIAAALETCKALEEAELENLEMPPAEIEQGKNDEKSFIDRRVRGPSILKSFDANKLKRVEIITNLNGVPIGPCAQEFTGNISSVVKSLVSIRYKNWEEVPEYIVKKCWIFLDMLYVIPTTNLKLIKWIKTKMKERFCQYKSRLFIGIKRKFSSIDEQIKNRPNEHSPVDWELFIRHRNSKEFQEMSTKRVEYVKQRVCFHHLGRKSLGQLEYEMKNQSKGEPVYRYHVWKKAYVSDKNTPNAMRNAEFAKQLDDSIAAGTSIVTGKDDAIATVFGPDKKGRARAVGSSITPTMAFGAENYKEELVVTKTKLQDTEEKLEKTQTMLQNTEDRVQKLEDAIFELRDLVKGNISAQPSSCSPDKDPSQLQLHNNRTPLSNSSKKRCNLMNGSDVVAVGGRVSDDPSYLHASEPIGEGNCLVYVNHVNLPSTPLYRPNRFRKTFEGLDGHMVVWPSSNIEIMDENKTIVDVDDFDDLGTTSTKSIKQRNEPPKIHERSGILVTRDLLSCLDGRQWLRDEIIFLYLSSLKDREVRVGVSKEMLKCHYFDYDFYKKLVNSVGELDFEAVRDLTSNLKYKIADCRLVFVPIILHAHWSLGIIDVKKRNIMHLDSINESNDEIILNLKKYIIKELKDKNDINDDLDDWTKEVIDNLPKQQNTFDCGVYVLVYAEVLSKGMNEFGFAKDQSKKFRSIIKKHLNELLVPVNPWV